MSRSASKIANRRSPSGPQVSLEMPFYGCTLPLLAGTYFVPLGTIAVAATSTDYSIPVGNALPGENSGSLDTLEVRNNPIAATATANITYRIYKNGAAITGHDLVIACDNVGPIKVDVSDVAVSKGDLIAIAAIVPGGGIADTPTARVYLSWLPQGNI